METPNTASNESAIETKPFSPSEQKTAPTMPQPRKGKHKNAAVTPVTPDKDPQKTKQLSPELTRFKENNARCTFPQLQWTPLAKVAYSAWAIFLVVYGMHETSQETQNIPACEQDVLSVIDKDGMFHRVWKDYDTLFAIQCSLVAV